MTLQQKIERLKKLEKDASKPSWYNDENHISNDYDIVCDWIERKQDREFIAETRNALPELLEALEEAIEIVKDDSTCVYNLQVKAFLKKHGIDE